MQSRSIPIEIVRLVLSEGRPSWSRGGRSYALSKASRRRLRDEIPADEYRRLERKLGVYVVTNRDGSAVLTAAHRTRRFRRR
jgi:hypothetical protein